METPQYPFRLRKETADKLNEVAKIYGASTGAAFLREMIEATIGGNQLRMMAFLQELGNKLSNQLQLELVAAQERAALRQQPVKAGRKARKATGRTKGRRHAA